MHSELIAGRLSPSLSLTILSSSAAANASFTVLITAMRQKPRCIVNATLKWLPTSDHVHATQLANGMEWKWHIS